jgi:uncharacterized protein YxjI
MTPEAHAGAYGWGEIERNGHPSRRIVGLRDHLKVDIEDGHDMKVHGNLVDHEYEIEGEHGKVAEISKKWFRIRDTYSVEIQADQDVALILAITVAVEESTHDPK